MVFRLIVNHFDNHRSGPPPHVLGDRKDETHSVLIDREKKRTVRKLELRSRNGRLLGPHDTVIKKTLR
jgi:hypothetical protein